MEVLQVRHKLIREITGMLSNVSLLCGHISLTHPRVRNACAGVLKGRQQADSQVMSQVEQLVIVALKAHLAKRMFWIRKQNVRGDEASQDPSETERHIMSGSHTETDGEKYDHNVFFSDINIHIKVAMYLL